MGGFNVIHQIIALMNSFDSMSDIILGLMFLVKKLCSSVQLLP